MFQSDQKIVKPTLSNHNKVIHESPEEKRAKIQIFYRYHACSMQRQLKLLPFETQAKMTEALAKLESKSTQECIEMLFKYASLNSKYRHRQKVRFERTPLLKFLKYDFARLRELCKDKKFNANYQDLHDEDESASDDQAKKPKQFQPEPNFSQSNIEIYKKKREIKGRVFVILGYQDLKQAFQQEYGWSENEELESKCYELKFVSKKKHIDYVNLLPCQYVNHFQENKAITAKFGLTRNIRNLADLGKNPHAFFPRCYDINDVTELEDFYEDFKLSKAKAVLLDFLNAQRPFAKRKLQIVRLCLRAVERELLPLDTRISLIKKGNTSAVCQDDWAAIQTWSRPEQAEGIVDLQLQQEAAQLYQSLKKADQQLSLNLENVWIVKPASLSRGRGIKTFNELQEILDYVVGCEISWVVQKYIERPLIVRKKKFDIRQWVLWTDFKPLRAWLFQEAYIRFCAEIYTPEDLKNRKVHLTNNSVTKGVNLEHDGIAGNMMDEQAFAAELEQLCGKQVYREVIKPQMRRVVYESLQSVLQNVQYRKNSFEVLGYDFMVDQDLRVWLIEVNSSPTMQYSTAVTTKLVKRAMRDLAAVIQHYVVGGKQYNANNEKDLYGGWQLIKQY